MLHIDEMLKLHQEFLNQQKIHQESQKETLKIVNFLNKTLITITNQLDEILDKFNKNDQVVSVPDANNNSPFHHSNNKRHIMASNHTTQSHLTTTAATATQGIITSDTDEVDNSDDERETIQVRKKPKLCTTIKNEKEIDESNNQQRLFNKFVRERVEQKLGKEFLLTHEIQEIDQDIMEDIKKEALDAYPPIGIRPRRAWHLAKASLRCRRRSLRRQKEKLENSTIQTLTSFDEL